MAGGRHVNSRGETVAIRTLALARSFDGVAAVAGFDLEVMRGEMFGLVGPDGAGKSTAIRLLCGLLKPTSGQGTVLGFDLLHDAEKIKGHIGYLSQNFTLYGDLTIDENIEFFADIHGVTNFHSRRDELLRTTGLSPFRSRLAQDLSGGMKKKLALACTLVHQPDLIFLDEPSTGVDPVSRGEFWNILNNMVHDGMTVVLTTPYLDEAERCDRIGLMYKGRIIMTDEPGKVKERMPGKMYSISCPDPVRAYRALRAQWPATHLVLYADQLKLWVTGEKEIRESTALLQEHCGKTVTFAETSPSMEDAFVGLITSKTGRGDEE
jgi:ABC-2 type transport system ATP-binding protein